ncbi:DUF6030 family protein [Pannonibacter carbonis]|uniref:DUF6030 family protein n=1 Tax=Pannonibacter carbonis TaxID=2067569 RepID=UPI000D10C830|nr:DUF6030 family protein [Pannonibacter carbonis]
MKEAQKIRRRYRPLDRFRASMRADKRKLIWGDAAPPEPDPAPRRKRRWDVRRLVLLGLPPLILLGTAVVALGVYTDWRFAFATAQLHTPLALPDDPLAPLPGNVQALLVAPEPELPAALKLSFIGLPTELCIELALLGLPNTGWSAAPFQTDRWQCSSELVPVGAQDGSSEPTTLFFLMRGTVDRVDFLRLKLNAANPRTASEGLALARKVLDSLSRRYAWEFPTPVLRAISNMRSIDVTERGVRFRVSPEDPNLTGDLSARDRLNVIIEFSPPDHIRPARFEGGNTRAPASPPLADLAPEGPGQPKAFGPIEFKPLVAFPPEGGTEQSDETPGLPPLDTAYPPLVGIPPDGSEPPSPTDGSALVSPPAAE